MIDFNGYTHYCRNEERMTGDGKLKAKIMENINIQYIPISILDWLLLDEKGKKEYVYHILKDYIDI